MAQTVEKITYTATAEQVEQMHAAFDEALIEARELLGKTYPMIINGEERTGGKTFTVDLADRPRHRDREVPGGHGEGCR